MEGDFLQCHVYTTIKYINQTYWYMWCHILIMLIVLIFNLIDKIFYYCLWFQDNYRPGYSGKTSIVHYYYFCLYNMYSSTVKVQSTCTDGWVNMDNSSVKCEYSISLRSCLVYNMSSHFIHITWYLFLGWYVRFPTFSCEGCQNGMVSENVSLYCVQMVLDVNY